jgi:hypothetical protein
LLARPAGAQEVASAPASEPERKALPPEYPPPSTQGTLALTGAAVLVGWYGLAAGSTFIWSDYPGATDLRIPVAGPWMAIGQAGCPEDNPGCSKAWVVVRAILMGIDGVGQAGGTLVLGEALVLPTSSTPVERAVPASEALSVRPVPFVSGDGALGLGLVGRF